MLWNKNNKKDSDEFCQPVWEFGQPIWDSKFLHQINKKLEKSK